MKDWHPEDVRAAIRKSGVSLPALAARCGCSAAAVQGALYRRLPRVQALIATHLGISPQQIWPSRYDEDGKPIQLQRGRKPRSITSIGSEPHDQKRAAG